MDTAALLGPTLLLGTGQMRHKQISVCSPVQMGKTGVWVDVTPPEIPRLPCAEGLPSVLGQLPVVLGIHLSLSQR